MRERARRVCLVNQSNRLNVKGFFHRGQSETEPPARVKRVLFCVVSTVTYVIILQSPKAVKTPEQNLIATYESAEAVKRHFNCKKVT